MKRGTTQKRELLFEKESYIIRGAAFDVYKKFRSYHKEKVYRDSLFLALKERGLAVTKEKRIDIFYGDQKVGTYIPDIIIGESIFVELKAKPMLVRGDIEQFWHYLKNSSYRLGFLINFGATRGVHIIRKVYDTARKQ